MTGCWTQVIVRHGLSGQLERIKSRLEHISENQKEYKIEHTPLATLTSSTTAIAAWYMILPITYLVLKLNTFQIHTLAKYVSHAQTAQFMK
jgi:hypothetical protein